MARITISDDLPFVDSKYELGMLSAQRVRDLNGGEAPVIPTESGEKPSVTALREIASGRLDIGALREEFVRSYKKLPVADEAEESLESNAEAPELKELDEELTGVAEKKEELESEADEDLVEESEGTNDSPATGEQ